jgi:hypothetical protein
MAFLTSKDIDSFEETARLIIMEKRNIGLTLFVEEFMKVHAEDFGGKSGYAYIWNFYAKYHGVDGRVPTHDPETGRAIYYGMRK